MDSPPVEESRRRAPGGGGKARNRLGLKKASVPAPSPAPGSSPAPPPIPPLQPPISASGTSSPAPAAPSPAPAAPNPTAATPTSSPAAPTSTVLARPPQGAGWGTVPPNFLHGNQQGTNSWIYLPGGFLNMMQQSHYPPQPHVQGENFHFVGQISPPRTEAPQPKKQRTSTSKRVDIAIDEYDNNDANKPAKKGYWTSEEEERLASAWLNASKDPVKGNDKKGDTFWKEVTDVFNLIGQYLLSQ